MRLKYLLMFALLQASVIVVAATSSPYAGQETRAIKSLTAEEVESLKNGEGMGFAKLAELNHYPGPRHVLDLAEALHLTPSQLAATEALFAEMRGAAVARGEELLAAEAALDRAFAEDDIDAQALENALLDIGELRARLRYVHLEAHLRQKRLLTQEQVLRYDEMRGYGDAPIDHGQHSGHH